MAKAARIPEIIVCPASSRAAQAHIEKTVAGSTPWALVAQVGSDETVAVLQPAIAPEGELHFWGFRDNNRIKRPTLQKPPQSWERMPVGSLLIFTNRENVSHTAVIAARAYDPALAAELWEAEEFHWIVALRDVQGVTGVSSAELREAAGFGAVFMAHPVQPSRQGAVLDLLDAHGWSRSTADAASASAVEFAPFDPDSPLSIRAEVERRVEQGWLRRQLIPGDEGDCELCAGHLPVAFLRAAHVKPRHLCSDEERRDSTNAIAACVQCDVAFERGWLSLDDDQTLLVTGPGVPRVGVPSLCGGGG